MNARIVSVDSLREMYSAVPCNRRGDNRLRKQRADEGFLRKTGIACIISKRGEK